MRGVVHVVDQTVARAKRSPKRMANRAFATDHSLGGMIHSFSARFKAGKRGLRAASSSGKCPLARTARLGVHRPVDILQCRSYGFPVFPGDEIQRMAQQMAHHRRANGSSIPPRPSRRSPPQPASMTPRACVAPSSAPLVRRRGSAPDKPGRPDHGSEEGSLRPWPGRPAYGRRDPGADRAVAPQPAHAGR